MIDSFDFVADKYTVGDIENIFTEEELKKYKKAIPKSKKIVCDYLADYDFGFFKITHKETELKILDCIDIMEIDVKSGILIIIPSDMITKTRVTKCYKFIAKEDFELKHEFAEDTCITLKYKEAPSAFHMFVTPFKTEQSKDKIKK